MQKTELRRQIEALEDRVSFLGQRVAALEVAQVVAQRREPVEDDWWRPPQRVTCEGSLSFTTCDEGG